jgi:hypothetical protein
MADADMADHSGDAPLIITPPLSPDVRAESAPAVDVDVGALSLDDIEEPDVDCTPHISNSQPPPLEHPVEAALKKNRDAILCQCTPQISHCVAE